MYKFVYNNETKSLIRIIWYICEAVVYRGCNNKIELNTTKTFIPL